MECQFHIRRYIGNAPVIENDCVFERFPDHLRAIRDPSSFLVRDIDVIDLQKCHQIARWGCGIHRTTVPVLEQERHKPAVVKMRMCHNYAIEMSDRGDFRDVQVWCAAVVISAHIDAAINQYSRFRS